MTKPELEAITRYASDAQPVMYLVATRVRQAANQNQMSANVRGDRVEVLALLTPHRDEKVDGCEKNRDQGAEACSSIAINERTWQHQAEEAHP